MSTAVRDRPTCRVNICHIWQSRQTWQAMGTDVTDFDIPCWQLAHLLTRQYSRCHCIIRVTCRSLSIILTSYVNNILLYHITKLSCILSMKCHISCHIMPINCHIYCHIIPIYYRGLCHIMSIDCHISCQMMSTNCHKFCHVKSRTLRNKQKTDQNHKDTETPKHSGIDPESVRTHAVSDPEFCR